MMMASSRKVSIPIMFGFDDDDPAISSYYYYYYYYYYYVVFDVS
jgi:hypothetical protein